MLRRSCRRPQAGTGSCGLARCFTTSYLCKRWRGEFASLHIGLTAAIRLRRAAITAGAHGRRGNMQPGAWTRTGARSLGPVISHCRQEARQGRALHPRRRPHRRRREPWREQLQVLLRGVRTIQLGVRHASVVVRYSCVRSQSDRLVMIGDRILVPTKVALGTSPVAVGFRIVGLQPDRLVIICDRLLVSAEFSLRVSPVVVGLRIVGFQPDRLVIICDRLLALAKGALRISRLL